MTKSTNGQAHNDIQNENHRPGFARRTMARGSLFLICAVLMGALVLSSSGCIASPANETREDTFTVGEAPTITVDSFNGPVHVQGGPGGTVSIQATLRDTAGLQYEAAQNGDQITITVIRKGGWWFFSRAGADLEVSAPAGSIVNLKTSNGGIAVTGVDRGGTLRTSNGKVLLQDVKGDFEASTSNGRIEVNGMEGGGLFKTSNAKVILQDAAGSFNVSTSNSEISFSGEMQPGGQNRLTTSNGQVTVALKGTPSVELDAATSNGKVSSELPVLATRTSSTSLTGAIGAGEARLFIRTSNASITVK